MTRSAKPKTPNNLPMAEVLEIVKVVDDGKKRLYEEREKRREIHSERGVMYTIRPKEGAFTARLLEVDESGEGWISTSEQKEVTDDDAFVATAWTVDPSDVTHGVSIEFLSEPLDDCSAEDRNPIWVLKVSAADLENLDIAEVAGERVVSKWVGRSALSDSEHPEGPPPPPGPPPEELAHRER